MKTLEKPIWKKCTGEAHKNPFIDNCVICAPYWEEYPVCPKCDVKLEQKENKVYGQIGKCPECGNRFDLGRGK